MKKRILAFLLILTCIFAITACDKGTEGTEKPVATPEAKPIVFEEMTAEEKRGLNVFLSNFSEAHYMKGSDPIVGDEGKIEFAYIHTMLNAESKLAEVPGYGAISAERVDEVLEKYFGESVPHKTPADNRKWEYKDGNFIAHIPGGDSYGDFSVATGMNTAEGGNYEVSFRIYQREDVYGGAIKTDPAVFSLSDEEAAAKYQLQADGKAILKEKEYNGKQTYELVSYEVNYIV